MPVVEAYKFNLATLEAEFRNGWVRYQLWVTVLHSRFQFGLN